MDNWGISYNWDNNIEDVEESILEIDTPKEDPVRYDDGKTFAASTVNLLGCAISFWMVCSEPAVSKPIVEYQIPTEDYLDEARLSIEYEELEDIEQLRQSLKDEVVNLALLPDNWDGEGAYRMSTTSMSHILSLLDNDMARLELISLIYPNQNGFVSVQWENDDNEMVGLEIGRRYMSYFVKRNSGNEFHERELISNENINSLFACLGSL